MEYASRQDAHTPSTSTTERNLNTLYLAGGCFWGLEAYMKRLCGVVGTEVGYANGDTENPTYEDVCYRDTGHAETVAVTYDRDTISTASVIDAFFNVVDPTTPNRQGNDWGKQYRSGIYYVNEDDKEIIDTEIQSLRSNYRKPIVTEVEPLEAFYTAEEYHQDYLDKNPGGYCHIDPADADRFCAMNKIGSDEVEKKIERQIQEHDYRSPTDEQLKSMLTDEQYRVTQENATEFPYSNTYNDTFEKGLYVDITSGEPLFTSMDKFESGCGWPAFSHPIVEDVITEHEDKSLFNTRTEVRSRGGNAHLGHVFPDGPAESGGLRYCINSAALRFIPYQDLDEAGYGYLKEMFA